MTSFLPALQGVASAVDEMMAHRARSIVTLGGVAAAVLAVVAGAAAVRGAASGMSAAATGVSARSLIVMRWPPLAGLCRALRLGCARAAIPLTAGDARAIADLPEIRDAAAHRAWTAVVSHPGGPAADVALEAWSAAWPDVSSMRVQMGRSFTAAEDAAAARVVLVNTALAQRLFGPRAPLGATLRVAGVPLRVIGEYGGGAAAPAAIVPLETARAALGVPMQWLDLVVLPRAGRSAGVREAIAAELRGRRGASGAGAAGFRVVDAPRLASLAALGHTLAAAASALLGLAGLVIAGAHVLAGTLLSVADRTMEVGVRRALGATRAVILRQFLAEGATLATLGALAGLIGAGLVTTLLARTTPVLASLPPAAVPGALVIAALAGILCGLPAAVRAARLDTSRLLGSGGG